MFCFQIANVSAVKMCHFSGCHSKVYDASDINCHWCEEHKCRNCNNMRSGSFPFCSECQCKARQTCPIIPPCEVSLNDLRIQRLIKEELAEQAERMALEHHLRKMQSAQLIPITPMCSVYPVSPLQFCYQVKWR